MPATGMRTSSSLISRLGVVAVAAALAVAEPVAVAVATATVAAAAALVVAARCLGRAGGLADRRALPSRFWPRRGSGRVAVLAASRFCAVAVLATSRFCPSRSAIAVAVAVALIAVVDGSAAVGLAAVASSAVARPARRSSRSLGACVVALVASCPSSRCLVASWLAVFVGASSARPRLAGLRRGPRPDDSAVEAGAARCRRLERRRWPRRARSCACRRCP